MEKINLEYFGQEFNKLQQMDPDHYISSLREKSFNHFNKKGLPTTKNEEWKYTSVSDLFRKEYRLTEDENKAEISFSEIDTIRLAGYEKANELVFVNGKYRSELSTIRSSEDQLIVLPLEEAANGKYKELVNAHLGKSNLFIRDAIHALNTSFIYGGVFIYAVKGQIIENPVYLYHLSDARENHILSQPRSLFYVDQSAKLQLVETYQTIGSMDSFTNEVFEVVVNSNAIVEYYKIQNDSPNASQVFTTHIRQV